VGYNGLDPISKANILTIDKLLNAIQDWETIINKRHRKFVLFYLNNKNDLIATGKNFNFSSNDMLSIFWRVQKLLQIEYNERFNAGLIRGKILFVTQTTIHSKKKKSS